jgi:hypothetical protein
MSSVYYLLRQGLTLLGLQEHWYKPVEVCSQAISTRGFFGPLDTCGLGLPNIFKPDSDECLHLPQQVLWHHDVSGRFYDPRDYSTELKLLQTFSCIAWWLVTNQLLRSPTLVSVLNRIDQAVVSAANRAIQALQALLPPARVLDAEAG